MRHNNSLSLRSSLHLDPTSAGRRPKSLRACVGALVTDTERGEDIDLCDEHVGGAE
jgi:hypothetical protein